MSRDDKLVIAAFITALLMLSIVFWFVHSKTQTDGKHQTLNNRCKQIGGSYLEVENGKFECMKGMKFPPIDAPKGPLIK